MNISLIFSTSVSTLTAATSTLGTHISDTRMSSNSMADFISSPSLFSMVPSCWISSIITLSSSSVIVGSLVPSSPATFVTAWVSFMKTQVMGDRMTIIPCMVDAKSMATFSGCLLANVFGVISPIMRRTVIIRMVANMTPISAPYNSVNMEVTKVEEAMLTMLFPTNTVVRRRSKLSQLESTRCAFLFPSLAIFFRRVLLTLV